MKTILEIVGPRRSMQAILMEGGLAKTIFEIVSELGQLLASHSIEGGFVRTILEIDAERCQVFASCL